MGISQWFAAGAVIAVAVCGGQRAFAEQGTVVLGTTVPLSGQNKHSGFDTKNGYDLAIRRINERGGVDIDGKRFRLKVRYYDDESDPLRAQELVDKLINKDGVKFILGPYHAGQNRAVITTIERSHVPMVDAHSVVRKQGPNRNRYAFAVSAAPDQYFTSALEFAAAFSKKFGKTVDDLRIAMATQNDEFSRQVRAGVLSDARRLGIACIIDDQLPENFSDMSATLDRVRALKPDLFLVSGHESTALSAVGQIEKAGVDVPVVAVTHCHTARLTQREPESSAFVFCPVQWDRAARYKGALFGSAEDFAKLYEKTYGYEASSVSAQAAAAVYVFADAFERARSLEPEEVRDAISETDLETFFGSIRFDGRGVNVENAVLLTQIIDGDYVLIAPHGWAEREAVIQPSSP